MNIFDEEQVAAGWPSHSCMRAALPGIPWRCPGCEVEGVVGLICAIYAWRELRVAIAMLEAQIDRATLQELLDCSRRDLAFWHHTADERSAEIVRLFRLLPT